MLVFIYIAKKIKRGVNIMSERIVTAAQMKQIEKNAYDRGMSYTQMMENAGSAAYMEIKKAAPDMKKMTVIAGKGNNAGDGFVAARLAALDGVSVDVVLAEGDPVTDDAILNFKRLSELPEGAFSLVNVMNLADVLLPDDNISENDDSLNNTGNNKNDDKSNNYNALINADVIADALYGTGFHGNLRESGLKACSIINNCRGLKIAFDLPSGINADTGEAAEGAVHADITVVFDSLKHCHVNSETRKIDTSLYCGKSVLVDIGIAEGCHNV